MSKRRVLFLCTGNSCRSQMAEGLVSHFLKDQWRAYSAGTQPSGYVHPLAVKVMAELGVDIENKSSKSVDMFRDVSFDVIITVCDDAAESCPVWWGPEQVKYVSFPDPAEATGSRDEKLAAFRQVRDDIREQILAYLVGCYERIHFFLAAPG